MGFFLIPLFSQVSGRMHAAPQCSYVSLWAPHPSPTKEELCLSPPAPTEQPGRSLLVWGGHGTTSLAPEHFLLLALLLYLLFIVSTCHRCKRINHPKPCFPDSIYSSIPSLLLFTAPTLVTTRFLESGLCFYLSLEWRKHEKTRKIWKGRLVSQRSVCRAHSMSD